jgi:hypothetical protein
MRCARAPASPRSTRAARANGTCSARSRAAPSGWDARSAARRGRRDADARRRGSPLAPISPRSGIARASSGTIATRRRRSRGC